MLDWLLTGPLMDEAGEAGGGGTAVADVSGDYGGEPAAEPAGDGQVHDAEFVDPEAPPPEPETPPQQTQALVKAGERAVVNGKFTGTGKAGLDALNALSPKLKQEAVQAFLTRDYFIQQFPGGKKEVAQLRALAEQHGGEAGIGELQKNNAHLAQITDWFDNSSPQFVEMLAEDEERQAALVRLMPAFMEKFANVGKQHFEHQIAKHFAHLMDTARLPVTFARMADLLNRAGAYEKAGNHEIAASLFAEVTATYNEIAETLDKVYSASRNVPAAPGSAKDPALDDRAKQLTAREQALQKQEWETVVAGNRRATFAKAWAEVTKGRAITPDQDVTIKGFYELRMTAKLKQWQNQAERFLKNGDKDGYLREQFAFFKQAIPDALRQAMQQALPGKPGPKVAPAPGPIKPPMNGHQPANGAQPQRVAKMPSTEEFDLSRTSSSMISANRGYLKDGRLIQWA